MGFPQHAVHPFAERRVHRRTRSLTALADHHRQDLVVRRTLGIGRFPGRDVPALRQDVLAQQAGQIVRAGLRRGAQIEFRNRLVRHDVGGLVGHRRRLHAADIQRRILQRFLVIATNRVGTRDAQTLAHGFLIVTTAAKIARSSAESLTVS